MKDSILIHYHGTPIGGMRSNAAQFLFGRAALIPFPRPEDMAIACEVCTSVIIDNGAFSIWKRNDGSSLLLTDYLKFCDEWYKHPTVSWCLIPDVIDGTEIDNDALLKDWPREILGVPVWHYHESLDRLERLSYEWRTVALGSSGDWPHPGTSSWWERTSEAMRVICDAEGRPRCKLHGLRMLSAKILKRLPLSSADSTNVARNGDRVFAAPTRTQRMLVNAIRIESVKSASVFLFPRKQLRLSMND